MSPTLAQRRPPRGDEPTVRPGADRSWYYRQSASTLGPMLKRWKNRHAKPQPDLNGSPWLTLVAAVKKPLQLSEAHTRSDERITHAGARSAPDAGTAIGATDAGRGCGTAVRVTGMMQTAGGLEKGKMKRFATKAMPRPTLCNRNTHRAASLTSKLEAKFQEKLSETSATVQEMKQRKTRLIAAFSTLPQQEGFARIAVMKSGNSSSHRNQSGAGGSGGSA